MKPAHIIVSLLIVILGLVHSAFTFVDHDAISPGAFWFLGSGIALVLAGFLNIAATRTADTVVSLMTLIGNFAFLVLFAIAYFYVARLQGIIGIALFAAAILLTILASKARSSA